MKKTVVMMMVIVGFGMSLFAVGNLNIDSYPSNAKVFVDNKFYGETPLTVQNVNDGVHEVMVLKAGSSSFVEKVYVYSNDSTRVFADFQSVSKPVEYKQPKADPYLEQQKKEAEAERRRRRRRVRTRNTILGVAVVNEMFTKNKKHKRKNRNWLGGVGLLNELGVFGN